MKSFLADYFGAAAGTAPHGRLPGNGAFIHSCNTHCGAQRDHDWPALPSLLILQGILLPPFEYYKGLPSKPCGSICAARTL